MAKPQHHAFNMEANGRAVELVTPAILRDPLTGKSLQIQRAIWDTGASCSMVNKAVAQSLGLVATGQAGCRTANGHATVSTYLVDIGLPQKVLVTQVNVLEGNMDRAGLGEPAFEDVLQRDAC